MDVVAFTLVSKCDNQRRPEDRETQRYLADWVPGRRILRIKKSQNETEYQHVQKAKVG